MNSTAVLSLNAADDAIVRGSLRAAAEGPFFPAWEFETLFGISRETMRKVLDDWPQQTVSDMELECAVIGAMNMLVGYPHGCPDEVAEYVPAGPQAIEEALARLSQRSRTR